VLGQSPPPLTGISHRAVERLLISSACATKIG
jgi:hypothetical protein